MSPQIESDRKHFKIALSDHDFTIKAIQERISNTKVSYTPRSNINSTSDLKNKFNEAHNTERIHTGSPINNVPLSVIGIKRAASPLMGSYREVGEISTRIRTNFPPESTDRFYKSTSDVMSSLRSIKSMSNEDSTPPFSEDTVQPNFLDGFKDALKIHKSKSNVPSKPKDQNNNKFLKTTSINQLQDSALNLGDVSPLSIKLDGRMKITQSTNFAEKSYSPIQTKAVSLTSVRMNSNSSSEANNKLVYSNNPQKISENVLETDRFTSDCTG